MRAIIIVIVLAFAFLITKAKAADIICHNINERIQQCTGMNGYVVTCVKTGNLITCTGSDGKTETMIEIN